MGDEAWKQLFSWEVRTTPDLAVFSALDWTVVVASCCFLMWLSASNKDLSKNLFC